MIVSYKKVVNNYQQFAINFVCMLRTILALYIRSTLGLKKSLMIN